MDFYFEDMLVWSQSNRASETKLTLTFIFRIKMSRRGQSYRPRYYEDNRDKYGRNDRPYKSIDRRRNETTYEDYHYTERKRSVGNRQEL